MTDTISEYLSYIKELCGFAVRTVMKHKRICGIWKSFLDSRPRRIRGVAPQDLLDFIEYRGKRVKRSTLAGELCVIRTLYKYLYDFGKTDSNPAASLPKLICEPPDETSWLTVDECFSFLDGFDL
ncbi:MAG: site-specific integrase, partial [Deltaproteobacteria bacterium]|nr:site-specific integrase [Deltaproteobacteria bacterium]